MDVRRKPPKAGDVVVETFLFVGVMCITFFKLTSVSYLDFLKYVLAKDDDDTSVTFQEIVCTRRNSEVVWMKK